MPLVEWCRPAKDTVVAKIPAFRSVLTETDEGYVVDIVVDSEKDDDFTDDVLLMRHVHTLSVDAEGQLVNRVATYQFNGDNVYVSAVDPSNDVAVNPSAASRAVEVGKSGDLDKFWLEAGFDRTNP